MNKSDFFVQLGKKKRSAILSSSIEFSRPRRPWTPPPPKKNIQKVHQPPHWLYACTKVQHKKTSKKYTSLHTGYMRAPRYSLLCRFQFPCKNKEKMHIWETKTQNINVFFSNSITLMWTRWSLFTNKQIQSIRGQTQFHLKYMKLTEN